jgi:putative transposase
MSHRKRIQEKKSREKKARPELAGPDEPPLPPRIPPITGAAPFPGEPPELHPVLDVVIDAEKTGNALRDGAEPSLWACLKRLDPQGGVTGRLKKSDIDTIPPKYRVASVIGFLKGKSAIAVARLCGKERNFTGEHFWARGYAVSTVGFELEQVRQYIRDQEEADGSSGQF